MTAPQASKNRRQLALPIAFIILLWLPLAGSLLGIGGGASTEENRALAKPPVLELTRQAAREFPRTFEAWYNDHFGFRNVLVRQYHIAKTGWLGIADRELALIGSDGWLFLGRQVLIDEARGLNPASDAVVGAWARRLRDIQQWQEGRGGQFLLALVPDKHRVYPEYLPGWFRPSELRRKEQLKAALDGSGMEILDLTETLRAARQEESSPVYLKTDTHWNGIGAYHASRAVAERLGLSVLDREEVVLRDAPPAYEGAWHRTGNLAAFIGARELMPEDWIGLLPKEPRARQSLNYPRPTGEPGHVNIPFATEVDDDTLPRALVIGDSFRWALIPVFSESFRYVLYTDFRYCFFDPAMAEEVDPDVIIFIMSERQLTHLAAPPENNSW